MSPNAHLTTLQSLQPAGRTNHKSYCIYSLVFLYMLYVLSGKLRRRKVGTDVFVFVHTRLGRPDPAQEKAPFHSKRRRSLRMFPHVFDKSIGVLLGRNRRDLALPPFFRKRFLKEILPPFSTIVLLQNVNDT